MEINPRVKELVEEIRDRYGLNKAKSWTDYREKQQNNQVIARSWLLLKESMPKPTIELIFYVIETVDNKKSDSCQKLVLEGVGMCASKEQVARLLPHLPCAWAAERKQLLRKLTDWARDKDELVAWMDELKFI